MINPGSEIIIDITVKELPVLKRIADGDRVAAADCSRIHGPMIWKWAKQFTSSTGAAETATLAILQDILNNAKNFDAAQCSELTFIKQACIRRLMG